MREKALSKACKILLGAGLPEVADAEAKLRELHPTGPPDLNIDADQPPHCFDFTTSDVTSSLRTFDMSSGPGPSGLRPSHLWEMTQTKHKAAVLEALAEFCSAFCSGHFDADVMKLFTAARLVSVLRLGVESAP